MLVSHFVHWGLERGRGSGVTIYRYPSTLVPLPIDFVLGGHLRLRDGGRACELGVSEIDQLRAKGSAGVVEAV